MVTATFTANAALRPRRRARRRRSVGNMAPLAIAPGKLGSERRGVDATLTIGAERYPYHAPLP
jgi:hypothetical protein